jgi:hypothetical protein
MRKRLFYDPISGVEFKQRWMKCDEISIVLCWWYLISSDHQLYRVTLLKTPFGLVIPLSQSQSHVTTITHNYFLCCYTCTQLTITYTFEITITCSTLARLHSVRALHSNLYCTIAHKVSYFTQCVFTGWLLSCRSLSQIITHCRARKVFTSHCKILAENLLREFTS